MLMQRPYTLDEAKSIPLPFRIRPSHNDYPGFICHHPDEVPNAFRRCLIRCDMGEAPRVDDVPIRRSEVQ